MSNMKVVIGEAGIGKTTLCKILKGEEKNSEYIATLGVETSPVTYKGTGIAPEIQNLEDYWLNSDASFVFMIKRKQE